jgi:uncharacterized protein YggU (UPF0235/DUF167 family)
MATPAVRFAVRLTPRGGLDRIEGVVDGELRAKVAAPAVDGAANHAILRLIAEELDVPRTSVRLAAGASGRRKLVAIDDIDPAEVQARWPGLEV